MFNEIVLGSITENTPLLWYKDQAVSAVSESKRCVLWGADGTHTCICIMFTKCRHFYVAAGDT